MNSTDWPECPYCGHECKEWQDGRQNITEKVQCPNCLKKYKHTVISGTVTDWMHLTFRLGRKPKTNETPSLRTNKQQ